MGILDEEAIAEEEGIFHTVVRRKRRGDLIDKSTLSI